MKGAENHGISIIGGSLNNSRKTMRETISKNLLQKPSPEKRNIRGKWIEAFEKDGNLMDSLR